MRKIAIGVSSLTILFLVYYFAIGRQQAIDELKAVVDREIQTLQKSGFTIEDRNISKSSEHFTIHYANSKKIAEYLEGKNIEMSADDSREFEGMKIGTDIHYLDGLYSAISVDLYPISLPDELVKKLSVADKKMIDKIIKEGIVLLHVDINKLFNSFRGNLKDIDITLEDEDDNFTISSKGVEFGGDFDKKILISSYQKIDRAELTSGSGLRLLIDDSSGSYERGDTLYEYSSSYEIRSLVARVGKSIKLSLDDIDIKSNSKSKDKIASASYSMKISKADITQPDGDYILEKIDSLISVENFSIEAMDALYKADQNDPEATKIAIERLLSKDLTLKLEKFSVEKVKEPSHDEPIDGFHISASANIIKPIELRLLEQNPLSVVSHLGAKVHMELSDKLYLVLQKRPELMLLSMILKPIIQKDKVIFDLNYSAGSLTINGKPLL